MTLRSGPSSRILVIDDEPDLGLLLRLWLESAGHEVLEAASGQVAIGMLARHRPDLVLLDLRAPGTEGWLLLDELRTESSRRKIRVIVSSAWSSASAPRRAAEKGCAYITKPFDPNILLRTIETELCQRYRGGPGAW